MDVLGQGKGTEPDEKRRDDDEEASQQKMRHPLEDGVRLVAEPADKTVACYLESHNILYLLFLIVC